MQRNKNQIKFSIFIKQSNLPLWLLSKNLSAAKLISKCIRPWCVIVMCEEKFALVVHFWLQYIWNGMENENFEGSDRRIVHKYPLCLIVLWKIIKSHFITFRTTIIVYFCTISPIYSPQNFNLAPLNIETDFHYLKLNDRWFQPQSNRFPHHYRAAIWKCRTMSLAENSTETPDTEPPPTTRRFYADDSSSLSDAERAFLLIEPQTKNM